MNHLHQPENDVTNWATFFAKELEDSLCPRQIVNPNQPPKQSQEVVVKDNANLNPLSLALRKAGL